MANLSMLSLVLAAGVCGYSVSDTAVYTSTRTAKTDAAIPAMRCAGPQSARALLVSLGITPDTLAASGASVNEAAGVIAAAVAEWQARQIDLSTSAAAWEQANRQLRALEDAVMRGLATSEEIEVLSGLRETTEHARTTLDTERTAFRNAILSGLGNDARSSLELTATNRRLGLPLEYRVLNLTEEQSVALREQLVIDRQYAQRQEEPPPPQITLGQGLRARADQAASDLAVNAPDIANVWSSLLGD